MPDLSTPVSDRDSALALFSAFEQRASAAGLRPPPPEPVSCCGRGCNGCVWEGFYHAANYWREEALLTLQED